MCNSRLILTGQFDIKVRTSDVHTTELFKRRIPGFGSHFQRHKFINLILLQSYSLHVIFNFPIKTTKKKNSKFFLWNKFWLSVTKCIQFKISLWLKCKINIFKIIVVMLFIYLFLFEIPLINFRSFNIYLYLVRLIIKLFPRFQFQRLSMEKAT